MSVHLGPYAVTLDRAQREVPMNAGLALAMARAFGTVVQPLPRGFMRLLDRDGREVNIPCLADAYLPSHSLWHLDLYNDGRIVVAAHPSAWAELGAQNLAAAHRPEGVR